MHTLQNNSQARVFVVGDLLFRFMRAARQWQMSGAYGWQATTADMVRAMLRAHQ